MKWVWQKLRIYWMWSRRSQGRVKREFADAVDCRGIIHQPKRPRVEK